jgi:hypothetical protein
VSAFYTTEIGITLVGEGLARLIRMIEQPSKPDFPRPPDPIDKPPPDIKPVPPPDIPVPGPEIPPPTVPPRGNQTSVM